MIRSLLTRRQWLRTSAASLLAAGHWPAATWAGGGAFRFAVLNDLHYLNEKCAPWFEKVVRTINDQGAELVLIAGDLAEHGTSAQLGAVRDLLKSLKVPYYPVVGNHDFTTQTDRKAYEQLYPGRMNYHFDHQGWQFVALDTTEGQKYQNVKASQETLDWLSTTLPKLDRRRPTILFTHMPLAFGVPFLLRNAEPILEQFKPVNLQAVFSGHFHGFTEKKRGPVTLTTNKCCSFSRANHDKSPGKGYFLCEVRDGAIHRRFVDVPT